MAKINPDDIDALRERADIIDVVSRYSQLKKSGGQTFKGLCPFHSEKTPSFSVDAGKGLWHCFGCGEGGNIYHFIQKVENLQFAEAVEWLARKEGYQLRYLEERPGEKRERGLKPRLYAANLAAAEFFHTNLVKSPEAVAARRYLESRGFDKDVADRWMLGFAPGGNALCRYLMSKGFSQEELVAADLARKSDRGGSLYDTFRNRIIFPTWDRNNDVAGFGARAMGDQQPKYLNTSETPVFSKSRIMYGLNRAKSAIGRGHALVVEGYTDVIALHEAGIEEAVATNGVALGQSHFELLKKFSNRAILMFDADEAGAGATERAFDLQHRIGLEVLVAPLPPGRDPAELVKEDGPDSMRKIVDAAQPLMEFKLDQTVAKLPLDTPEARARAVRLAAEVLGWQPDPIARHQYAFVAARRIGVEPEVIHRALNEDRQPDSGRAGGANERDGDRRLPGHVKVEREALQLLLTRAEETAALAADLSEQHFTSPARRELFELALTTADLEADRIRAAQGLSPDALSLFTELTIGAAEGGLQAEPRTQEVFTRLRVFRLERDIKRRRDVLQEVNPLADPQEHDALFTELVQLEAERRDLLRHLQGSA